MRELKFRAWGKDIKKFLYIELGPNAQIKDSEWRYNGYDDWEQYTGLKDKNGKEIWEGDIVKVEDDKYTNDVDKFFGDNATVTTSELLKPGAFVIKNWYGERHLRWDIPLSRVEVIGNIHENKELLEGGK